MHKRGEKVTRTINVNFLLAFYAAVIAGNFVPVLMKINWAGLGTIVIECIKLFFVAQSSLEKILIAVVCLMIIVLILVYVAGIILIILSSLIPLFKDIFKSELIANFYIDYMEILNNIISEKESLSEIKQKAD